MVPVLLKKSVIGLVNLTLILLMLVATLLLVGVVFDLLYGIIVRDGMFAIVGESFSYNPLLTLGACIGGVIIAAVFCRHRS